MALTASPTFTPGSTGNIYGGSGGTALNSSTSYTTSAFYVGVSGQSGAQGSTTTGSALSGRVQIVNGGGEYVSSTNGLQVQVFSSSDGGTTYDTLGFGGCNFVITTVQSANSTLSFDLPPGQYKIKFTNLDGSYGVTVTATLGTTA